MKAGIDQVSRERLKKRSLSLTGFTLIELVMVILLTGILSMAGYHIFTFAIRNTFFIPNQAQADLAAASAMETMIEGDSPTVHGLRFSKSVTAIAANQVDVTDQEDVALRFRLDTGTGRLYRKIGAAAETMIPYFMPPEVKFSGSGGALFIYRDASEAVTADPANVRRIEIDLIAQQGAGSADNFQGRSRQRSSVQVNRFV